MRTRRAGFTLLELLVVVSVVLLFLAIAVPQFNAFRLWLAFNAATEDAQQMIDRARWRAINSGRPTRITISSGTLQLRDDATDSVLSTVSLTTNMVTASATNFPVTFDTRGFVAGTTPTLRITNARGDRTLTISPLGRTS